MIELIQEKELPRVILVGLDTGGEDFDAAMEELQNLAEACEKQVVCRISQKLSSPNKALYVGCGKVEEIGEAVRQTEASELIFDRDLSPAQLRNLQKELRIPILDRSLLILEIFALRARSREATLQVEVARLQYMLPRLVGLHEELGRQGGASGSLSNKGSGEKKIELDRRRIEQRISFLKKELKEIEKNRETQRKKRQDNMTPQISLVGYTNAGKSTIMNRLLSLAQIQEEKQVFEKDMLFATLDTHVRFIDLKDKKPFFLTDTVGFVQNLPHSLIEAFHSTLEEVKYADLLVQVVDVSDEHFREQMQVTQETLKEIGAGEIPMLVVYNKADRGNLPYPQAGEDQIRMSAMEEEGLKLLVRMMQDRVYDLQTLSFCFPYDRGDKLSYLLEHAAVERQVYENGGVYVRASVSKEVKGKLTAFLCEEKTFSPIAF